MVVTVGLTDGLAVAEVNPAGTEVQLYVLPGTAAAPRVVGEPGQIVLAFPATAAGRGLTLTTTFWAVLLHPLAVVV